jgi:hypothetical protein
VRSPYADWISPAQGSKHAPHFTSMRTICVSMVLCSMPSEEYYWRWMGGGLAGDDTRPLRGIGGQARVMH